MSEVFVTETIRHNRPVHAAGLTGSIPAASYIYTSATVAVKSKTIVDQTDKIGLSEDETLVRLSPIQRWKFIAKNNKFELAGSLLVLFASLYALVTAASAASPTFISMISISAMAQTGDRTISPSMHANEWVPLLLMSIFGIWSLYTISTSKSAGSIAYAKDTGKIILGFIGGFFGGGRVR